MSLDEVSGLLRQRLTLLETVHDFCILEPVFSAIGLERLVLSGVKDVHDGVVMDVLGRSALRCGSRGTCGGVGGLLDVPREMLDFIPGILKAIM